MPLPIAAGTSVLVVTTSVAAAATRQWGQLLADAQEQLQFTVSLGEELKGGSVALALACTVPWNLVVWQWPGVIAGAQLAAAFNQNSALGTAVGEETANPAGGSREVKGGTAQRAVGCVFCAVGLAFAVLSASP